MIEDAAKSKSSGMYDTVVYLYSGTTLYMPPFTDIRINEWYKFWYRYNDKEKKIIDRYEKS